MKRFFALCTLLTCSLLVAQNNCNTTCACCNCLGPICDPCTITPQTAPPSDDCGNFFLSADFLYWYTNESDLPFATKIVTIDDNNGGFERALKDVYNIGDIWDPGFRVGLGFNTECDGWDAHAKYTWFQPNRSTSKKVTPFDSITQAGQEYLSSPWFTPDNATTNVEVNKISVNWSLQFNQGDLEMGRHFWLSNHMTMRPFLGLRGGWNETHFDIKGMQANAEETTNIRFKRDFWGVGLLSGFNTTLQFTNCFGIYGDASFSLLWSHSDVTRKSSFLDVDGENYNSISRMHCRGTQAIFDLGLGLRYLACWCEDQYRFKFDLGWEYHDWLGYSRLPGFPADAPVVMGPLGKGAENNSRHIETNNGDLTLSGLAVSMQLDF